MCVPPPSTLCYAACTLVSFFGYRFFPTTHYHHITTHAPTTYHQVGQQKTNEDAESGSSILEHLPAPTIRPSASAS
jgi:hypothetical protein